jgi:hypothetical protein
MYLNRPGGRNWQGVEGHRLDLIARTVQDDLQSLNSLALVDCLDLELGGIEFRLNESTNASERPDN